MALSTLENLASLIGADYEMNKLDDEVIENMWLESRLTEVAETTAKRDLSFIKKFMEWASHKNAFTATALPLPFNSQLKGLIGNTLKLKI